MSTGSPELSTIATVGPYERPSGLMIDDAGNLIGFTEVLSLNDASHSAIFEIRKTGSTFGDLENILTFKGKDYIDALTTDESGDLLGAAGINSQGMIFKINKRGSTYHKFMKINGTYTYSLLVDPTGNIFGTTAYGAAVFEIEKNGDLYGPAKKILTLTDGFAASLIRASDGDIFGLSIGADASHVFELTKSTSSSDYNKTTLATFDEKISHPFAICFDAKGDLFGVTDGINSAPSTIYEIEKTESGYGALKTIATMNFRPGGTILFDRDGNIFGTGDHGQFGYGMVFEIKKVGQSYGPVTTVVSFDASTAYPSSLAADATGTLFGTFEGISSGGGVFELTNSGYQVSLPPPPRQDTWQGHAGTPAVPTDGFFDNAADWVSGLAPDSNTDALLGEGHYTVRTRAGTDYLHSLVVSSGATLVIGGATYATTLTTTATTIDGRLTVERGSEVSNSGATDIGGVLRLRGGLLTGGTIDGHGGGALVGDGTIESSLGSASGGASALSIDASGGSIILTGDNALSGSLSGSGTLEFLGGSDVLESGLTVTAGSVVLSGSHVTLQASLSFNHNLVLNAGTLDVGTNDLNLQGQTTLTGGSINGTDGSVIRLNGARHDVVSNGSTSIAPRVLNNGVVDIEGGSLDLMGHVYGAGDFTFSTSKPASLELGDTLGKNQTIDFGTNASAQLIIDKNYTFEGMIANLRSSDTIDLTHVSLRGTSIGFAPGNTDVLQVTRAGRTVASLKLSGAAYDGSQFSLSADAHTGSLITFHG